MCTENKKIKDNIASANAALKNLLNETFNINPSKADKLSYWFKDYVKFRRKEDSFNYGRLKNYKRGDVIKADFGFRIGAELGGLHYCIVLDNNNSKYDPLITVIPLISVKPHINIDKLPNNRLYLGHELRSTVIDKCKNKNETIEELLNVLKEKFHTGAISNDELNKELDYAQTQMNANQRAIDEVLKMKNGSIALLSQMTTISKMRIHDPVNSLGALNKVRISDNTLDKINIRLNALYMHNSHIRQN